MGAAAAFLPRINRMLIYYEKRGRAREEEGQYVLPDQEAETADTGYLQEGERNIKRRKRYHLSGEGSGGSRKHDTEEQEEEELKEYLEDYYYEYGLVPQLEPYRTIPRGGRRSGFGTTGRRGKDGAAYMRQRKVRRYDSGLRWTVPLSQDTAGGRDIYRYRIRHGKGAAA